MDQHELRIATFRRGSAWLVLPAILLIATAGAAAYFFTNLPAPFEDWMLVAAAAAIVLFAVVLPWWVWASRSYIVTTRRVIETRGLLIRRRREILHQAGYMIEVSRGPLQRMLGRGTPRSARGTAVSRCAMCTRPNSCARRSAIRSRSARSSRIARRSSRRRARTCITMCP